MQFSTKSRYPAQIMVVSLLVMTILGIIVVGIVGLANRDVVQTVAGRKHIEASNAAETSILALIDKYGNPSQSLNATVSNFSPEIFSQASCQGANANQANCSFTDTAGIQTSVTITNKTTVDSYQMARDESLELNLQISAASQYKGQITFSTDIPVALEFGILSDEAGTTQYVGDLFDQATVFDSSGGDPLSGSNNHPFNFSQISPGNYAFTISNITGISATSKPLVLRVVARMDNASTVKITLAGSSGFPAQIREFVAEAYDPAAEIQTSSKIITQIPLLPQLPNAFYNVLLTQGEVKKG